MTRCSEIIKDGKVLANPYNDKITVDQLETYRRQANYLCPKDLKSLEIQGHFGSEIFDFFQIDLLACDPDENECFTDD